MPEAASDDEIEVHTTIRSQELANEFEGVVESTDVTQSDLIRSALAEYVARERPDPSNADWQCEGCSLTFSSQRSLRTHREYAICCQTEYVCDQCGETFDTLGGVGGHQHAHATPESE